MTAKNEQRLQIWIPWAAAGAVNLAIIGAMYGRLAERVDGCASKDQVTALREQVSLLSDQLKTMDARQWNTHPSIRTASNE